MKNARLLSSTLTLSLLALIACGDDTSSSGGGGAGTGAGPSTGGSAEGGAGTGGETPMPVCGDGTVDAGEECDAGMDNADTGACTTECKNAACGDGKVQAGVEDCDEGAQNADTGACTTECKSAACGDGLVQAGVEDCDDGAQNGDTAACLSDCTAASCGDGFVEEGVEECDQGGQNSDTGACLSDCAAATCGDGKVQAGVEGCDDGNQNDNDACTNNCALASCGDGIVQAGEGCDLGGQNANTGSCTLACMPATCGDGFIQAGVEQCDLGGGNNNSGSCTLSCDNAVCGDGFVYAGFEPCDDGNGVTGDGCNNNCVVSGTPQWTQGYANPNGAVWFAATSDTSGNFYVAGAEVVTGQGLNVVVRKYGPAGTALWTQTYAGAANLDDAALGVAVDSSGNVIVVGFETLANGTTNLLIRKHNGSTGASVWSYSYDGGVNGNDYGAAVIANASGDLYVTGQVTNTAGQGTNVLAAKLAGINGTVVWADFINGTQSADDAGNAVTTDAAGAVYYAGVIYNNGTTGDLFLRKYSDQGVSFTNVWQRSYNGSANLDDSAFGVATDAQNNVIVGGFEGTSAQAANAFLRKYDASGNTVWTQTFSGAANLDDVIYGVRTDANGNVAVGGYTTLANNTTDVWVRKYSSAGAAVWTQTYNGASDQDDVVYGLAIDPSMNVFAAGREVIAGSVVNGWARLYAP